MARRACSLGFAGEGLRRGGQARKTIGHLRHKVGKRLRKGRPAGDEHVVSARTSGKGAGNAQRFL